MNYEAKNYDQTVFAMFGGRDKYEGAIEKLVAFADIQPSESVLELCCGTGISTKYIFQKTKEITAVELNPERMEEARWHLPREVRLIPNDARYLLPKYYGTYDLIICINGFHYFNPPETFYDTANKMLKPEGRVVFNVKLNNYQGVRPLAERAGKVTGRAFAEILVRIGRINPAYRNVTDELKDTGFIASEYTEESVTVPPSLIITRKETNTVWYDSFNAKNIFYNHWYKILKSFADQHHVHESVIQEAAEEFLSPLVFGGEAREKLAKAELFIEARRMDEIPSLETYFLS